METAGGGVGWGGGGERERDLKPRPSVRKTSKTFIMCSDCPYQRVVNTDARVQPPVPTVRCVAAAVGQITFPRRPSATVCDTGVTALVQRQLCVGLRSRCAIYGSRDPNSLCCKTASCFFLFFFLSWGAGGASCRRFDQTRRAVNGKTRGRDLHKNSLFSFTFTVVVLIALIQRTGLPNVVYCSLLIT